MPMMPPEDDSANHIPHHEDCDGGDGCHCADHQDEREYDYDAEVQP